MWFWCGTEQTWVEPCDRITYGMLFLITVGVQKESPTPSHSFPAWFGVGRYGPVGDARRVWSSFRMTELASLLVILWMIFFCIVLFCFFFGQQIKLLERLAVALARFQ